MTATANIYSAVSEHFTQMLFLPPGIPEADSSHLLPLFMEAFPHHPSLNCNHRISHSSVYFSPKHLPHLANDIFYLLK